MPAGRGSAADRGDAPAAVPSFSDHSRVGAAAKSEFVTFDGALERLLAVAPLGW